MVTGLIMAVFHCSGIIAELIERLTKHASGQAKAEPRGAGTQGGHPQCGGGDPRDQTFDTQILVLGVFALCAFSEFQSSLCNVCIVVRNSGIMIIERRCG